MAARQTEITHNEKLINITIITKNYCCFDLFTKFHLDISMN